MPLFRSHGESGLLEAGKINGKGAIWYRVRGAVLQSTLTIFGAGLHLEEFWAFWAPNYGPPLLGRNGSRWGVGWRQHYGAL